MGASRARQQDSTCPTSTLAKRTSLVIGPATSATDWRLYVGSRDKTSLLDGVQKQIDHVTNALAGTQFADVPVRGSLCFVEVELGWFAKPFTMRGITVTWRKHLLAPMLEPATIGPDRRAELAPVLADHFRPA
jgi:hypothetical protein